MTTCAGNGQLGDGSTTGSPTPIPVDVSGVLSGKEVTTIRAGGGHTCVVAASRAYCWGWNAFGQIGDGTIAASMPLPTAVDTSGVLDGKNVTAVRVGAYHTCALADGEAFCWGENVDGQLGDGTTTDSKSPSRSPLRGRWRVRRWAASPLATRTPAFWRTPNSSVGGATVSANSETTRQP
ncbi:MAG: hypothetical protein IPG68_12145 [Micrococcales bacterium]|nr:hypothetical protein [Micrococcales bacterium]